MTYLLIGKYNLYDIGKIFTNTGFIIFSFTLLFIISLLFNLLNHDAKITIINWILYPITISIIISIIIIIASFNILYAMMCFVFLLSNILPYILTSDSLENFTNKSNDSEDSKDSKDSYVNGIKNLFTSKIKELEKHNNNELTKGILENKRKILQQLNDTKSNNKQQKSNKNTDNKSDKIITKRKFNPNDADDTNLLITKEILLDMINRIEYNYENKKYLKRYIRSRIEEIIETNNLLDEDL